MSRAKGIILTLRAFGKAGEPAGLPQGPNAIFAAGENFMRISLMTHIPNQPIMGRIEDVMQNGRQFDNTQASTKVAARN